MRSIPRRSLAAAVTVALAVTGAALSGCSASGGSASGGTTVAAGPTAASGAPVEETPDNANASLPAYTPPARPPAAVPVTAATQAAAVDFVIRYLDALNYGYAHGDADPLRAMSTMECQPCVGWIKDIQHRHDRGLVQQGGYVRLVGMRVLGKPQGGRFGFRASLLREPGAVVAPAAAAGKAPAASPTSLDSQAELVDLVVGPVTSKITEKTSWSMISMVPTVQQ